MEKELVSVIMPTYNGEKFIAESIDSILNQTYKNLELLITDDNSTSQAFLDLLDSYAEKDNRIKIFHLDKNYGPGVARNNSIKHAKGRYIAFCDSDDRWIPEKLEKQIAFIKEKNCALCCSSYILCDEKNHINGINYTPEKITFSMYKRDNKIGCLTAVYDIKKLGQKYYMPSIRKRQDWALFLEILKECKVCYAIKEPLAYYRIRKDSISSKKLNLIKYNIAVYKKILHFSSIKSYLYFIFLFVPTFFIKVIKRKYDSLKFIIKKQSK
jgi:glycosyltransferase involved in cell wall biosynthesis